MWAPLAAVFLLVGAASTPSMIEAERAYLQQQPTIEVQDIQAAQVSLPDTHRLVSK
jgi:hypothetical protein